MKTYPIGERSVIESALYQYDDDTDERVVGIQVEFIDAPSCAGRDFEDYLPVTYSGTSCAIGDESATRYPTQVSQRVSRIQDWHLRSCHG